MIDYKILRSSYDVVLMLLIFSILGLGLVMVFSASSELAQHRYGDGFYFFKRQCFSAFLGILMMIAAKYIPYGIYRTWVYPLLGFTIVLLISVHIPGLSRPVGGAARWIRFGAFSFQPSELAKLALVMYMAYSLEKKGEQLRRLISGYLPHLIMCGFLVALILPQPDMGMAVILCAIMGAMLFAGGARMSHLCLTVFSALPLLIWAVMGSRYRLERILTFTNPWEDSLGRGFQIVHSFFAFGSGGVWGAGIGDGKQKLFYLPEPHTDFIFSVLGEELGFVGVCVMIVLYFLLIYKAFRIARAAPDRFGYYLGLGLCFMMGFPILVHLGVVLGLMPTKGMALPLMSYGGSSLLINLIGVGILLNINSLSRRESKK